MPDVDDQLADLRTDLRNAVPVPGLDTITERHRQRRNRRRTQVAAVAVVLLVSGIVPILRMSDGPPSGFAPADDTAPAPGERFIGDLQFAEDGTGYALRAQYSETDEPVRPFALTLLTSADLENWQEVGPVPTPERADGDLLGKLLVLGPDELVVNWVNTSEPTSSRSRRVHSGDGGRTWQDVPMPAVVNDVVPAIPEGAHLLPACFIDAASRPPCETPTFTVVKPGSGASATLANPPGLVIPIPGSVPTADGHWWAFGQTPGTKDWAIAVSTDDGRTWATDTLDVDLANDSRANDARASVVSQGGTLYASVTGTDPRGKEGVRAIFRSDDDGETWRRTWTPAADQRAFHIMGTTIVAAQDGTLKIMSQPMTYTFTDDGRSVKPSWSPEQRSVQWTRGGYLLGSRTALALSTDGVNWREFEIPTE